MKEQGLQFSWIRQGWLLAAIALVLAFWWFTRPPHVEEFQGVPLGVEQAAIVTYSGPAIAIAPYRWGAGVNARIASVAEQDRVRVYDIRYIVNRGGTFDLKDYLVATDGSALEGLPSFKIQGNPKLSKDLESRIQETEPIRVEIGGHYLATLGVLGAIWIFWLLLLVFYKRPKRPEPLPEPEPEPSTLELLRSAVARLKQGELDAAERARLEMIVLRHLREDLNLTSTPMYATVLAIGRNEHTRETWQQLQHWLHRPGASLSQEQIAEALEPLTATPKLPEPVGQS